MGERRGEMNRPPPQLANSKEIKLSLVAARLFHGALWGTGAFGESRLGPGPDVSKEGEERISEAWGAAVRIGQAEGAMRDKAVAVTTISLTCTSLVESLGSVTVWAGC